jgi:hypothetical protein
MPGEHVRALARTVVTRWCTELGVGLTDLEVELRTIYKSGEKPLFTKVQFTLTPFQSNAELFKIVTQAQRERKIVKVTIEVTDEVVP